MSSWRKSYWRDSEPPAFFCRDFMCQYKYSDIFHYDVYDTNYPETVFLTFGITLLVDEVEYRTDTFKSLRRFLAGTASTGLRFWCAMKKRNKCSCSLDCYKGHVGGNIGEKFVFLHFLVWDQRSKIHHIPVMFRPIKIEEYFYHL